MTEPHSIADDQVQSAFRRWLNLEEEKARISDDLKELFAQQKAHGHDTKAMRAAFRLKVKMDAARPEDAEHEALVDMYLAALSAPSRTSRACAHGNIEQFSSNTNLNRPAPLAGPGGDRSIPSPDAGGAKMDGSSHPGRSDELSAYLSAKSGQATNSHYDSEDAA